MQNDPNSPSWGYGTKRGVSVPLADLDEALGHLRAHGDVTSKGSAKALTGLVGGSPSKSRPLRTDADDVSEADSEAMWTSAAYFEACQRSQRSQSRSGLCAYETDEESVDNGMAVERRTVGRDEDEAALGDLPERKGCIYRITCKVNGKLYVGQTLRPVVRRMKEHAAGRRDGQGEHTALARAIKRHGWGSFSWEVLEKNIPESKLNAREIALIAANGCVSPAGYNLDSGGSAGGTWSTELKERHSVAMSQWANREDVRRRKKEVWADPEYKQTRSVQRKRVQNVLANVLLRREKWDGKREEKLKAEPDPQKRRGIIIKARMHAKKAVKAALKRGVTGRDLWAEFHERWMEDDMWVMWLASGATSLPRGCPCPQGL